MACKINYLGQLMHPYLIEFIDSSKKKTVEILHKVNGVLKPSRLTLLLGLPGSGKTTLLKALAGVLEKDLRVTGQVTYCGHDMSEFIPQRTCAYISQHDLHHGELTVRETLDFSGRFLGVGTRYDLLSELSRREKDSGIKPDVEIDAFMKATALSCQHSSLVTDYVLKILGLDICADIMVGDVMRRGISGGQKKRVTTGEMLGSFIMMDFWIVPENLTINAAFGSSKFVVDKDANTKKKNKSTDRSSTSTAPLNKGLIL
ncbi:hypothetical protein POM88_008410 [Heracleum sosnowskyi]|uniref:ABC transporter domain-containing protein n=1 Tax=Heracleum sosnowskyi TaxID=360622 RepID=A0AAD8J9V2_9APIA|nr:hypothetical protein POM88_008410 [Heracleum sosnowskyi]